jgi:uncharacterized lipoprotein YddW (UPF0748 family)
MKYKFLFFFIILFYLTSNLLSQSLSPKREFRGAWIASVVNLDWPSTNSLSSAQQKQEIISLLDSLKAVGFNAVIFQIRSECDAMYNSSYDPWSYWLTGHQGLAPNPFYDPLEFAVQESHKRGMEFHAWFNPYRAIRDVQNAYTPALNHVSVLHPDWIVTFGNIKVLDPGLPLVRSYVTSVVMDVVKRYDIDGVHFDDYFYPYPDGVSTFNDDSTLIKYSNGYNLSQKSDWRRNNVNMLVKMIYDSIQIVKPYVKFGISPFGIWKSGTPSGITGLSAYDEIYCDAVYWLNNHIIDYLTPQLYWPFGGGQDYGKLMPWWGTQINGRHLYPGQGAYRIVNWSASELPNQIRADRNNPNVQGSIMFRALDGVLDNPKGFKDTLRNYLFRYPALIPVTSWKDSLPPLSPANLRYEIIASSGKIGLTWTPPSPANDNDTAFRYVIYRFDASSINQNDLNDPSHIVSIEMENNNYPTPPVSQSGSQYYIVTSLDRLSNESSMSNILKVDAPLSPLLVSPFNDAINQGNIVLLKWQNSFNSSSYRLQVSSNPAFTTGILTDRSSLPDTSYSLSLLQGLQKYYWRVSAGNAGGTSSFSTSFNFTSGFPPQPRLVYPDNHTLDIPLKPDFAWSPTPAAQNYRFQLAWSYDFNPNSIVIDTSGISDTLFAFSHLNKTLLNNTEYFWRVSASNQYGTSQWASQFNFLTINPTIVKRDENLLTDYQLSQNYPNPFNPITIIKYTLAKPGLVTLKVYDLLGNLIVTLADEEKSSGTHTVQFDASNRSSGMYIYQLTINGIMLRKKMILLK